MKTILVTGDSGLIGSNLMPELKKKMKVIGLGRKHERKNYKTINLDLAKDDLPSIPEIDAVIHLAADIECKNQINAFATNVLGTKKLLEFSKMNDVKSFIYASTGAVYGFGNKPFKETDKLKPHNFYSKTKYDAELLCTQYSQYFPVTILRYFFPYGCTDKDRLINRLVNKVRNNEPVELNIKGRPVINPMAVKDAARATVKAIRPISQCNTFNIGGKEAVSILQIVRIIEDQLGKRAIIKYNDKQVGNMVGDITRAEKILNFKPRITLKRGIKEIIGAMP